MNTSRAARFATAVLAITVVATPAAAHVGRAAVEGVGPTAAAGAATAKVERPRADEADELAEAKRLAEGGQIKAAIKVYKSVLGHQRDAGAYPKEALTELAYIAYGRGDEMGAAAYFDELTAAARTFGDPETQLTALVGAAMLYREAKQMVRVSDRVQQIRPLLKSPAISEKTRTQVSEMLTEK